MKFKNLLKKNDISKYQKKKAMTLCLEFLSVILIIKKKQTLSIQSAGSIIEIQLNQNHNPQCDSLGQVSPYWEFNSTSNKLYLKQTVKI